MVAPVIMLDMNHTGILSAVNNASSPGLSHNTFCEGANEKNVRLIIMLAANVLYKYIPENRGL